MSAYLEMTPKQFEEFNEFPNDTKLSMLNLLKYKKTVDETGKTGEEAYNEYMEAVQPFFVKSNAKVVYVGKPQATLIGPDGEWDKVMIVDYDQKKDFLAMVSSEGYPSDKRQGALEDSRLIFCESIG